MYVSRVLLDRQNRETMVAMVYPQRFHGAVERAFPGAAGCGGWISWASACT